MYLKSKKVKTKLIMKKDSKGFLEFVYEFYKTMKAHEISLVYEGEITHQITKAFTSLDRIKYGQRRRIRQCSTQSISCNG